MKKQKWPKEVLIDGELNEFKGIEKGTGVPIYEPKKENKS